MSEKTCGELEIVCGEAKEFFSNSREFSANNAEDTKSPSNPKIRPLGHRVLRSGGSTNSYDPNIRTLETCLIPSI